MDPSSLVASASTAHQLHLPSNTPGRDRCFLPRQMAGHRKFTSDPPPSAPAPSPSPMSCTSEAEMTGEGHSRPRYSRWRFDAPRAAMSCTGHPKPLSDAPSRPASAGATLGAGDGNQPVLAVLRDQSHQSSDCSEIWRSDASAASIPFGHHSHDWVAPSAASSPLAPRRATPMQSRRPSSEPTHQHESHEHEQVVVEEEERAMAPAPSCLVPSQLALLCERVDCDFNGPARAWYASGTVTAQVDEPQGADESIQ